MEPIRFATEDHVSLEGELRLPDREPVGSAVICHPHPRHGGSKDHPILWAIRNELAHRGFVVVGFNFRGVMGSGGSYGGGRDELRDVRAAIGVARERAGAAPTIVCGWSFGASVALREALDDDRVGALALIGIPLDPKDVELPALPAPTELRTLAQPVLLIAGERDEYCAPDRLGEFGAAFPASEVVIVKDTDHYFWRRERELASIVGAFAERAVEGAS
jgi:alpha/beta superfamily hydrolase